MISHNFMGYFIITIIIMIIGEVNTVLVKRKKGNDFAHIRFSFNIYLYPSNKQYTIRMRSVVE